MDRYRLRFVLIDRDLEVHMAAWCRTKQLLRDGYKLARRLVDDGVLERAEAWDEKNNTLLASATGARREGRI